MHRRSLVLSVYLFAARLRARHIHDRFRAAVAIATSNVTLFLIQIARSSVTFIFALVAHIGSAYAGFVYDASRMAANFSNFNIFNIPGSISLWAR